MSEAATDASDQYIESISFRGRNPGPRLLVLGAVHGIEICGPIAIQQVIEAIHNGGTRIDNGVVTFVPIANPRAFLEKRRFSRRDMNRDFKITSVASIPVDYYTNILASIMAEHDVLLDLHSFRAEGRPFVFVGPENNTGTVEPFALADKEQAFATALGVTTLVDGWLNAYTKFAFEQATLIKNGTICVDPSNVAIKDFGRGTTEYFRSLSGKFGVTIECGQHDHPRTVDVARNAVLRAINHLGISKEPLEDHSAHSERASYRFSEIFLRESPRDSLERVFSSFDAVREGDKLGTRHNGMPVLAPSDGVVIFNYPDAKIGKEWIYFAESSSRFRLGETSV